MRKIDYQKFADWHLKKAKKAARQPFGSVDVVKKNAAQMSKKMTWPEKEFAKLMKEMKITCLPQKIVGSKIFDFYIPKANLLVEIDGDYYHGHPDIYAESDLNAMQKKNIKNDKFKDILAGGRGFDIIRIWETDLKKDLEGVKAKIIKKLGI